MVDWSKGYSVSYYMTLIDSNTWRDIERIELTGGSISRSLDGLRQSASLDCSKYPPGIEQWIRVWMDVKQAGSNEHVPLFTGLATSPGREQEGVIETNSLECYSVLKAADDIDLLRGWYAPQGVRGGDVIKDLLSVVPAPVVVEENSPMLSDNIIAMDDDTNLSMIERLLVSMSAEEYWDLRIEGNGSIYIGPVSGDAVATFDPIDNPVVEPKISTSADWFSCPNVFMAINNDIVAIARDEDPESSLSIPNRGREVWMRETNCDLADNETTEQYAFRRLHEEQKIQQIASYDRRYIPNVFPGDYIRMHYPEQDLDGIFRIISQNIELSHSAKTSEEVETEGYL